MKDLAAADGVRDLRTKGVLDTNEGNEDHLLLEASALLGRLPVLLPIK